MFIKGISYQFGATLLEILVVVAIIIIMSGFGLANYRGVQANNELRDAAELLKNAILETQALALGPRNTPTSSPISRYIFQFNFSGADQKKFKILEGYVTGSPTEIRNYFLPDNISFNNLDGFDTNYEPSLAGTKIALSVEQGGQIIGGIESGEPEGCFELVSTRTSSEKTIVIGKQTSRVLIQEGSNC